MRLLALLLAACAPDSGLKVYNNPPEVAFTAPANGTTVAAGASVTFEAQVHDAQQAATELDLVWKSSDGTSPEGTLTFVDVGVVYVVEGFEAGDWTITLQAIDDQGDAGDDSVNIHVTPDEVPTATFLSPLEGDTVLAGDSLRVELQVADADEADLRDLTLTWGDAAADVDAPTSPDAAGLVAFYLDDLAVGNTRVSVDVTDSLGVSINAVVGFEVVEADADGDGHRDPAWGGDDCDDTDDTRYPGAPEACDGIDHDCDGAIDEDDAADALVWYADTDGDGYGESGSTRTACDQPAGWVADDTDCDDGRAEVYPGAPETCDGTDEDCDGAIDEAGASGEPTWYADADGDGFGDAATATLACDAPAGTVADATDCDDSDGAISPIAVEHCDDVDEDCDGVADDSAVDTTAWYVDSDGDGAGGTVTVDACDLPAGATATSTDCDDGDAEVYPGAPEVCDREDDDCDGTIDEPDAVDATTWYLDADGDGWGATSTTPACTQPSGYAQYDGDCDDGDTAYNPGAAETDCADPNDYNCDGSVGYDDADLDGWAACQECDDQDAAVSPDAVELCNLVDDDCDGTVDEDDAIDASTWYADSDLDGYGDAASPEIDCDRPLGYLTDATDCDDADASEHPGVLEICDGDDDDCDGEADEDGAADVATWYADADGDSFGDPASSDLDCDQPSGYVADSADCDDTDAGVSPADLESCDGEDDDCDGTVDEDDAIDAPTWYTDADGDSFGDPAVSVVQCDAPAGTVADGSDCDDADAATWPGADELCDGADDDCDGTVDEDDAIDAPTWYADVDGDGFGDAADAVVSCAAPTGYVADGSDCDDGDAETWPGAPEVCDLEDDDCDGTVDEDDAVDAPTWYADADGDGWGGTDTTQACTQPADHVAYDGDCDDADPAYNPGEAESDCSDPADYNCDGSVGYVDADADGWAACAECDDTNAAVSPDATEACNTIDDDCDGSVDEDDAPDASTWFADADSDTYGDAGVVDIACDQPYGYVLDATDCDDSDSAENPVATERCDGDDDDCDAEVDEDSATDVSTWYADADGDTYGNAAVTEIDCDLPLGYVADATDCDDTDADVSPADLERCDSEDDDCDGTVDEDSAVDAPTWYADADADTYGSLSDATRACSAPAGHVADATDCDDTDAGVSPSDLEACDGEDDDCDGTVDEDDAIDAPTWYVDADADAYGSVTSSTRACSRPSGFVSDATDCDDTDAGVSPADLEYCDGEDDDCDGTVDESAAVDAGTWYADTDGDAYGNATASTRACTSPSGHVANASDCDDTDAGVSPADLEYCDGEDDDCDGTVDEASAVDAATWYRDADTDTFGDASASTPSCSLPAGYVAIATDCDDTDAGVSPVDLEYCDGEDDDCDGVVDDGAAVDGSTWYADADGDGFGDPYTSIVRCAAPVGYVADADDCDDTRALTNPDATEECNGEDDDCDGTVDEDDAADAGRWYLDLDGDEFGQTAVWVMSCEEPAGYAAEADDCDDSDPDASPDAYEYCDGDDDNCDGDIDGDDAVDATTWYADADADTYGNATVSELDCYAPATYVGNDDDCDDSTATVSPADTEVCDAANTDEDCDGLADDADTSTSSASKSVYYTDADVDGHAGASTSLRCDGDATHLTTSTDCDDSNAAISPSDLEICDAADTDEDCDGTGDEAGASGCTTLYVDADADGFGDTASACLCSATGLYTATTADDCDDTVAAVNPAATENETNGRDDDCDGDVDEGSAELSPHGDIDIAWLVELADTSTTRWGENMTGGTDFDGDGLDDLLVGGAASSYGGASSGLLTTYPGTATRTRSSDHGASGRANWQAGPSTFISDQIDGDGYPEVVIGAPGSDSSGSPTYDGRVFIVTGADFMGTVNYADTLADTIIRSTGSRDDFGASIANAGDVFGDGEDDFLVGELSTSASYTAKVYLYDGPYTAGTIAYTTATTTFTADNTGDLAGARLDGDVDFDGDGYDDFVIGAPGDDSAATDAGAVYVILGGSLGATADLGTDYDAKIVGAAASDAVGYQFDVGEDIDDDGHPDLFIGVEGYSTAGGAFLFSGLPSSGSITTAPTHFTFSSVGGGGGQDVELLGDMDADGHNDVAISDTYDYGYVYIHYDAWNPGSYGPEDAGATFYSSSGVTELGEELEYVGDFDGDGYADLAMSSQDGGNIYWVMSTFDRLLFDSAEPVYEIWGDGTYNPYIGYSFEPGDFNFDGYGDLMVAGEAVGTANGGGGVLWFGPNAATEGTSSADGTFEGATYGDNYGQSLIAGDFDGDSYDDWIFGGPLDDTTVGVDAGAIAVVSGASAGYSATLSAVLSAERAGDKFGWSLADVEDGDSDGSTEILVGAPYHDLPAVDAGRVYLYETPLSTSSSAVTTLKGVATLDYFGYALGSGGDVDGDGFNDYLIGAYGVDTAASGAGAAYLYTSFPTGTQTASSVADAIFLGEAADDAAGTAVAICGDVNADGYDDILVGAPGSDATHTNGGAVYLLLGPPDTGSLSLSTADERMGADKSSDGIGTVVAGAGDMDGDGYDDVVFGNPLNDDYGTNAGKVGFRYGPVIDRGTYWWFGNVAGDELGTALKSAGDTDLDGVLELGLSAPGDGYGRVYLVEQHPIR